MKRALLVPICLLLMGAEVSPGPSGVSKVTASSPLSVAGSLRTPTVSLMPCSSNGHTWVWNGTAWECRLGSWGGGVVNQIGVSSVPTFQPYYTLDVGGDARIRASNKLRFGGGDGASALELSFDGTNLLLSGPLKVLGAIKPQAGIEFPDGYTQWSAAPSCAAEQVPYWFNTPTGHWGCSHINNLATVSLSCSNGEVPVWSTSQAKWLCGVSSGGLANDVNAVHKSAAEQMQGPLTINTGLNVGTTSSTATVTVRNDASGTAGGRIAIENRGTLDLTEAALNFQVASPTATSTKTASVGAVNRLVSGTVLHNGAAISSATTLIPSPNNTQTVLRHATNGSFHHCVIFKYLGGDLTLPSQRGNTGMYWAGYRVYVDGSTRKVVGNWDTNGSTQTINSAALVTVGAVNSVCYGEDATTIGLKINDTAIERFSRSVTRGDPTMVTPGTWFVSSGAGAVYFEVLISDDPATDANLNRAYSGMSASNAKRVMSASAGTTVHCAVEQVIGGAWVCDSATPITSFSGSSISAVTSTYPFHPTGDDRTDLVMSVWSGSTMKEALRLLSSGDAKVPEGLVFADSTRQTTAIPSCTSPLHIPTWSTAQSRWVCGTGGGGGGTDPNAVHIEAGGVCTNNGEVPTWSSISGVWTCAVPSGGPPPVNMVTTDSSQTIGGAKTFSSTIRAASVTFSGDESIQTTAFVGEFDPTVNALAKATLACSEAQIAKFVSGSWVCAADGGGSGGEGATFTGDKTITGSLTVNGVSGNVTLLSGVLNLASGGIKFSDGSVLTSATLGANPTHGRFGEVLVGTSATLVGTSSSKVSINIQNLHYSSPIFCGFSDLVAVGTGTKVDPGASLSLDYGGPVYCISQVAQSAGYGTRYLETTTESP